MRTGKIVKSNNQEQAIRYCAVFLMTAFIIHSNCDGMFGSLRQYSKLLATPMLQKLLMKGQYVHINKYLFAQLAAHVSRNKKRVMIRSIAQKYCLPLLAQFDWHTCYDPEGKLRHLEKALSFDGKYYVKRYGHAFYALLNQLPWNGSEKGAGALGVLRYHGMLHYSVLVNDKKIKLCVDPYQAYLDKREWVSCTGAKEAIFSFINVSASSNIYEDPEHHEKVCEEFTALYQKFREQQK